MRKQPNKEGETSHFTTNSVYSRHFIQLCRVNRVVTKEKTAPELTGTASSVAGKLLFMPQQERMLAYVQE